MRSSHAPADRTAKQMNVPVQEGFNLHACKGRSRTLPMACLVRTVLAVQTVAVQCVLHGQLRMLRPAACRAANAGGRAGDLLALRGDDAQGPDLQRPAVQCVLHERLRVRCPTACRAADAGGCAGNLLALRRDDARGPDLQRPARPHAALPHGQRGSRRPPGAPAALQPQQAHHGRRGAGAPLCGAVPLPCGGALCPWGHHHLHR